jgi:hypothetical protein
VHNTLAVNGQHQLVTGSAPIISSGKKMKFMNAVEDLSDVYKGQIKSSQRGIAIVNKSHVLVRDEIETLEKETTIRWTMLTPASVKIVGNNKVELTKDGKTLMLEVDGPQNIVMKTWSTDPPNSYDAPNPGTTLVGFEVSLPASSKTAFNVKLIPTSAGKIGNKKIKTLDEWNK